MGRAPSLFTDNRWKNIPSRPGTATITAPVYGSRASDGAAVTSPPRSRVPFRLTVTDEQIESVQFTVTPAIPSVCAEPLRYPTV